MLIKRKTASHRNGHLRAALTVEGAKGLDRRGFLKNSGLAAGGIAAFSSLTFGGVKQAEAGPVRPGIPLKAVTNLCTHCSVGCTVVAELQNDVWVGQEPAWNSPINRGSHCCKGASSRELVKGDRRVKTPLKLVNGEWTKVSWDQAVNEIGDKMLEIRAKSGPDSVYLLGSAKFTNEAAYLFRKFAAFWGTNNVDHQARICHSTTVAGVANTWGYGAQTNSYNDIRNSKTVIFMGSNAAEAHPVAMQHILTGKETNKANVFVFDPRFTRTAAHATEYLRFRSGTDIPIIWGMLWHIFKNGWEDKQYIEERVYGMHLVRAEVEKWTPEEVERVTGVPGEQLKKVAETFAKQRPSTFIWCMGGTQHTVGTANVRAYCILLLATGNVGANGTGANIFRGHTNVQGATDLGIDVTTLPLYYGLAEGAWKHWARVWDVDYNYLVDRFVDKKMMEAPGIPSTRWFDATLLPKAEVAQKDTVKAMFVMGHGGNTIPRIPDSKRGLEKLDLLVVIDPHPTTFSVLSDRKDGTYILPACTSFEMDGSRTASNRSLQWGSKVVDPIFDSKNDYEIIYLFAKKLGFADQMFKNLKLVQGKFPEAESILREINLGGLSTGYSGQSPERLKEHMANQGAFDIKTLKATEGPLKGEFYGLPWPCWGKPELKHPGTPILYNPSIPIMEGGGTFRARFGVTYEEVQKDQTKVTVNLLSGKSGPAGAQLEGGYPEFTYGVLKKLGWDSDLTAPELETIMKIGGNAPDGVSWSTDLSAGIIRVAIAHGCIPYGNGKARANAWNLPDPIPVHREPIYTPRPELVSQYPTRPDGQQFRVPNIGLTMQKNAVEQGVAKSYPLILTSGRLVEYEGGGEETRSNPWLAELQQDMFVEINPSDAGARGIAQGQMVWVSGATGAKARVKALVTDRVGRGVAFMPFHFAGYYQGADQRSKYPKSADPIVLGESVNTITTYGYDPVTGMHEGKATLCQISAA